MDRAIFDTYVRTQLVPTLQQGDIVILDNLPAHKSPAAEQAIRDKGAWLVFLPPYSPDLNPIEMAFAKLKAHLRAMAMRTIDELWKAIGQICDLFTPQECANYFEAAGYGFNMSVRCSRVIHRPHPEPLTKRACRRTVEKVSPVVRSGRPSRRAFAAPEKKAVKLPGPSPRDLVPAAFEAAFRKGALLRERLQPSRNRIVSPDETAIFARGAQAFEIIGA